jgi:hypothetical protein
MYAGRKTAQGRSTPTNRRQFKNSETEIQNGKACAIDTQSSRGEVDGQGESIHPTN